LAVIVTFVRPVVSTGRVTTTSVVARTTLDSVVHARSSTCVAADLNHHAAVPGHRLRADADHDGPTRGRGGDVPVERGGALVYFERLWSCPEAAVRVVEAGRWLNANRAEGPIRPSGGDQRRHGGCEQQLLDACHGLVLCLRTYAKGGVV
jgi:hypothetical protein